MGRCPSCVRNLRLLFCSMTCGPHQSRHLSANSTVVNENNQTLITKLNNFVEEEFALNLYDSCKEVSNPSSNSRAITTLCGAWGELCNADRFVQFLFVKTLVTLPLCSRRLLNALGAGPEQGGLAPFDIYFIDGTKAPSPMEPFNPKTTACYEPISVSILSQVSLAVHLTRSVGFGHSEHQRSVFVRGLQRQLPETCTVPSSSASLEHNRHGRSGICHAHGVVRRFGSVRDFDAVELARLSKR